MCRRCAQLSEALTVQAELQIMSYDSGVIVGNAANLSTLTQVEDLLS